jgi:hypothetical protein
MSVMAMTWAWEQNIPAPSKLVLMALADHADDSGRGWPGINRIASKCGMSRRTVQRHITALSEQQLIAVDRQRRRDNGSQTSNIYQLPIGGVSFCHGGDVTGDTGGVSQLSPPEPSLEPSVETTTIPLPEWLEVLGKVQPLTDAQVERLLKWAAPHDPVILRETAYIVVEKWPEYFKKNKSIFGTFQNWVRRSPERSDYVPSRYLKPTRLFNTQKPVNYTIEAYIKQQGLHPASPEAQRIREEG